MESVRASMLALMVHHSSIEQIMAACQAHIPDKIFLWNPDGKYLRYYYPNPKAKHYKGPEKLVGHYIEEVLPGNTGKQVFSVMRVAWLAHQMQLCTIHLPLEGIAHQVHIRFFPNRQAIIGLVNDFKIP